MGAVCSRIESKRQRAKRIHIHSFAQRIHVAKCCAHNPKLSPDSTKTSTDQTMCLQFTNDKTRARKHEHAPWAPDYAGTVSGDWLRSYLLPTSARNYVHVQSTTHNGPQTIYIFSTLSLSAPPVLSTDYGAAHTQLCNGTSIQFSRRCEDVAKSHGYEITICTLCSE